MKKITIVICLLFMALAVIIFATALTFPKSSGGVMGPGFFPMILSGLVLFLSALLLFSQRKEKNTTVNLFTKSNAAVLLSLLITVLYVALIRVTGFPIATALYLFGLMKFFDVKGWLQPVLISLITTGILYLIFSRFLSVQLPRGILFY